MKDKLREFLKTGTRKTVMRGESGRYPNGEGWGRSWNEEVVEFNAKKLDAAILDAEGDGGAVDSMHALLSKALMNYRCNRTVDEDGEPLPLVDVLSPGEGGTIQPGIEEIEFLAEYLADELPLPSTHPVRSGVVSDEDVEAACAIYFGGQHWPHGVEEVELVRISMRAALEHFAKGERHER